MVFLEKLRLVGFLYLCAKVTVFTFMLENLESVLWNLGYLCDEESALFNL